jgi:serine/threonine-protein kinase
MDYLDGPTFADGVRDQKLWPLRETVRILGQLCDALTAVHAAGLVHHDLNPNNVILGDRVMLLDFGCATPIGARYEGPRSSCLTRPRCRS